MSNLPPNRPEIRRHLVPVAKPQRKRAKAPLVKTMKPVYTGTKEGIRISHSESIAIPSNANLRLGMDTTTLLWIRSFAGCFEEWRVKFHFEWVPTCSAVTDGAVRIAWDADPLESAFGSTEEYFNTADHLVQSVWMPGTVQTKQSGWLKTGTDGFPREYSPGAVHIHVDPAKGYLLARYLVEFRGAQPNASDVAVYTGTFSGTGDLFGYTNVTGNRNLIDVTSGTALRQTAPGRMFVVWSTDSSAGTYTQDGTGTLFGVTQHAGVRTLATWYLDAVDDTGTLTRAVAPGGPTAFKISVFLVASPPMYS